MILLEKMGLRPTGAAIGRARRAAPSPARQRAARSKLAALLAHPASVNVIHYACQSFSRPQEQGSPRVAAIAVRNLASGQTESFSFFQEVELWRKRSPGTVPQVDDLERAMLNKFFDFLRDNRKSTFLHWNMRDLKFGFSAIEHRYSVLGGEPYSIGEHNRADLALLLADIYGSNYIPAPHLETLAERNGIPRTGFIAGGKEAEMFSNGEFLAVLQSVLAKVSIMSEVVQRTHDATLATDANWWTMNLLRVREASELFGNNPVKAWFGVLCALSFFVFSKLL